MLSIGQRMNGYTVIGAVPVFRNGVPESVVILGMRWEREGSHYVTARICWASAITEEPTMEWEAGHYFDEPGKAREAMRNMLDRGEARDAYTTCTVKRSEVTPQSTKSLARWVTGSGEGEELTGAIREVLQAVTSATGDVRVMIEEL